MAAASWFAAGGAASANMPVNGGVNFREPATEVMAEIVEFHNFLLPIITIISIFVLILLLWVMVRYNRRANPTPKRFTHNLLVEVIWTVLPVVILVVISVKSFPLLFKQELPPTNAELTLKVTGNSWFWTYEYPDLDVQVVSNMLPEEDARSQGRPWLLATDNPLLVPVDTTVRVLVTSNDVIHAFALPEFGVKEDAIQGRVNETWFNVDSSMLANGRSNIFYGQCSELCGVNHAYMPIEIRAVSRAEFDQWVQDQGGTLPNAATEDAAAAAAAAAAPAEGAPSPSPAAAPAPATTTEQ